MAATSDKVLWVCELNKETPFKKWTSTEAMEDDEDDSDFIHHSLVIKTAVLGSKAVENERNLVGIKTDEFEQPLFSLTLGRNDMVSNLDITVNASGDKKTVEFKLLDGTGPVFITCMHVMDMPPPEEQHTIMTTSDMEACTDEDDSEEVEDEEEEETDEKEKPKKNGTAKTNGGNALALKKAMKNGETNGIKKDEVDEICEKPTKRKRN